MAGLTEGRIFPEWPLFRVYDLNPGNPAYCQPIGVRRLLCTYACMILIHEGTLGARNNRNRSCWSAEIGPSSVTVGHTRQPGTPTASSNSPSLVSGMDFDNRLRCIPITHKVLNPVYRKSLRHQYSISCSATISLTIAL